MDKYNHLIDALRYAHVNRMRSVTSGSVYKDFNVKCLIAPFEVAGTVFTGTYASPGRVLTVSAVAKNGAFIIVSDYAMNGELDFEKIISRFSKACDHVWFPLAVSDDVSPLHIQKAMNRNIEPGVGFFLPAEGEGTELVNRLFANKSLFLTDHNHALIGALTERSFRTDGQLESQRAVTELVRYCELTEYTIWRMHGRMAS